jgi:hypothetical protein
MNPFILIITSVYLYGQVSRRAADGIQRSIPTSNDPEGLLEVSRRAGNVLA